MKRRDLRKEYKPLYSASAKRPVLVGVPPLNYIMIDGQGDPNTSKAFGQAVGTLYSVSYTLKFTCKKSLSLDYTVMGLEGLWWMDDMRKFGLDRKDDWKWTMMIMQPDFVPRTMVLKTIEEVKKKSGMKDFPAVRFETLKEGECAQILHVGPYCDEGPTIRRLHEFIRSSGHALRGKHHEIYMSDPRRTAPDKLRTILRQPIG